MTVKRAKKKGVPPITKKISAVRRQSGSVFPAGVKSHDEIDVTQFVRDISEMIDAARKHVAATANITLVTLYWQIGKRVHTEVPDECRASEAWRCA
ncbi:MAG: hypothetical protein QM674_14045 [Burkholderiaceae bacterium]